MGMTMEAVPAGGRRGNSQSLGGLGGGTALTRPHPSSSSLGWLCPPSTTERGSGVTRGHWAALDHPQRPRGKGGGSHTAPHPHLRLLCCSPTTKSSQRGPIIPAGHLGAQGEHRD